MTVEARNRLGEETSPYLLQHGFAKLVPCRSYLFIRPWAISL